MVDFQISVPCGHCLLCNHRKRVRFASKCSMETQSHDRLPLFVTLTYDDENLPPFGLRYSDVQRFLKRLRIRLVRYLAHPVNIRYACCGEYGKHTQRAHYHLLIWGFPEEFTNLFKIDEFIRDCWSNGITQTKRCYDSNAGFYLGKYFSKSVNLETPKGCNPPFVRCSINLGVAFVSSVVSQYIKKDPCFHDYHYNDKFSGKLLSLPLTSYFLDKVLPTVNKSLSVEYRNALFDAVNASKKHRFMSCVDMLTYDLLDKVYIEHPHDDFANLVYQEDVLQDAIYKIAKSHYKYDYIELLDNQAIKTQYYTSLFADVNIDLQAKAYSLKKSNDLEFEKERY